MLASTEWVKCRNRNGCLPNVGIVQSDDLSGLHMKGKGKEERKYKTWSSGRCGWVKMLLMPFCCAEWLEYRHNAQRLTLPCFIIDICSGRINSMMHRSSGNMQVWLDICEPLKPKLSCVLYHMIISIWMRRCKAIFVIISLYRPRVHCAYGVDTSALPNYWWIFWLRSPSLPDLAGKNFFSKPRTQCRNG